MDLIQKIQGEILYIAEGSITYLSPISGEIQGEDYINLNGFVAYLQNLSKTEYTEAITLPVYFGLKNQYNKTITTLEINY
jgi:hypothetical protein